MDGHRQRTLAKKLEQNIAFVAEMDSTIVGFADISHEGYLDRMYVHKDYQARWVSLHLFRAIEKAARELGLTKLTTDCSITKSASRTHGFRGDEGADPGDKWGAIYQLSYGKEISLRHRF